MNAAHAIRRLEEAGFTHQQATGVVEVVQGEVIEKVATREYVGEQIALVRKELAEQIGAVRQELAGEAGSIRAELASAKSRADAGDQPSDVLDERFPRRAPGRRARALRYSDRQALG